jgi:hypothetical protein
MLKKIVISILVLQVLALRSYGFDLNNNRLGITLAPITSYCYELNGGFHNNTSFDNRLSYNLGFKYLRIVNPKYQIETGINYSKIFIYLTEDIDLLNPYQSRFEQRNILSIPICIVRSFKDGFFISLGTQVDVEVNTWTKHFIDRQNGLGFNFSIGKTFHVSENIYFSLSPIVKIHSVLPFASQENNQHLFDYGIKIDLTYGFLR